MATKAERFPKEYLNAAALKDKPPMVLVIEEERLEEITNQKTGKAEEKSVLAFEDTDAKLILNKTNFELVVEITGEEDSANWSGHEVELYADKTSMGGNRVDCIRVRAPGSGVPAPKTKKAAASDMASLKATLDDGVDL